MRWYADAPIQGDACPIGQARTEPSWRVAGSEDERPEVNAMVPTATDANGTHSGTALSAVTLPPYLLVRRSACPIPSLANAPYGARSRRRRPLDFPTLTIHECETGIDAATGPEVTTAPVRGLRVLAAAVALTVRCWLKSWVDWPCS
jgi:hypothetical protein